MVLNYSETWFLQRVVCHQHNLSRAWCVKFYHHDLSRGWSTITMISPEDGLPSPSLQRMVYYHHDLCRGWSTITMISPCDGPSMVYHHQSLHMMVYHHYDLSRGGSVNNMIYQEEGLSSPWSLQRGSIITMISPEGLSSTWSLQRRVYHQHDLSRGWSFNHHCCPTTRMVPGCLYWTRWSVPWPGLSSCPWVWPLLPHMSPAPAAAAAPLAACALRTENSYTTLVLFLPWLSSAHSSFTFTVSDQ